MSESPFAGKTFNIIKHRGTPTEATTLSGHKVKKEEYVYIRIPTDMASGLRAGDWMMVKCADYHNEHFVYINPLYLTDGPQGENAWFAVCTCGSPAVIINPRDVMLTHEEGYRGNMLVCHVYMLTLTQTGVGKHATGDGRKWW